ncbi:MAG: hypothetical protein JOZ41_06390, partial [Chloroflexi bacterium]|nr:hypothetical protein [Chloroflexota bacterium]
MTRRTRAATAAALLALTITSLQRGPLSPLPASSQTNIVLGSNVVGVDQNWEGYLSCSKVMTGSADAAAASMTVAIANADPANTQFQEAIYADASGIPGAKVAQTAIGTIAAGWNSLPIGATLHANTPYWLCFISNGTAQGTANNLVYRTGTMGDGAYSVGRVALGTLPATFSGSSGNVNYYQYSIYVTGSQGAALTPTAAPSSTPTPTPTLDPPPPATPTATPTALVYTVPASIPHDCSANVDPQLNSWLASVPNGATIEFPANGCYNQDGEIDVINKSNMTIEGNGSTFHATTQGTYRRSNWVFREDSNVAAENMTVYGAEPDATITNGLKDGSCYYHPLEWQMGYDFQATSGGTLNNVKA